MATRAMHLVLFFCAALLLACAGLFAVPATADAQVFQFRRNVATNRCMDDSFAFGLRAFPCNGGVYQYITYESGTFGFRLRFGQTGRCVDDSLAFGLQAFPCNGTRFQQWTARDVFRFPAERVIFHTNFETGRSLDDSLQFGLRSFPQNRTDFQLFRPTAG